MAKEHLVVGICAAVDAGKTTLAECILYMTGCIRKLGRVDHKDAFLDTYALERQRGITIFSKQAECSFEDRSVSLLDTPGHVDFGAEMERTLQVLDYAILVINGVDGVQGHVLTLWKLLDFYKVPVFIFVNKMDQDGTDRDVLMEELKAKLSTECVSFMDEADEDFKESVAMCDEALLEEYLLSGEVDAEEIKRLITERKLFPCFFGSALKCEGTDYFLEKMFYFFKDKYYPKEFKAKIYKITRDDGGNRLTHMKITGGSLKTKTLLKGKDWEDKVEQIRIYNGNSFNAVNEISAGKVCAVTGLDNTYAGEYLGESGVEKNPVLEPVFSYKVNLPEGTDINGAFTKLKQLEEEIPELKVGWRNNSNEIHVFVMGEVQMEILKYMIKERFDLEISFGAGSIVYKETIADVVEGVGHYEPLRHYAEVHLVLEPGKQGSGLVFASSVGTDQLSLNWQRLVLTHLAEVKHPGVLTGADITDMKITLAAGRAHNKHTEGGDFRQATYRAVRHGLRRAKSVLLEPYYEFTMELPQSAVGRAMNDVQNMSGTFEAPEMDGEVYVLKGMVPASEMHDYQSEFISYTKGQGVLSLSLKGYFPCHNEVEVVEAFGYEPEADLQRPTSSVFCTHGAGFEVPWDEVEDYMHLPSVFKKQSLDVIDPEPVRESKKEKAWNALDKELEAIFTRTYGEVKTKLHNQQDAVYINGEVKQREVKPYVYKPQPKRKEYLLIDGYNIICAWEDLKELSKVDLKAARDKLIDILCNYQGYRGMTLILVFDAYKVKGFNGEKYAHNNIYVVYTKEAETADSYIEKTVHDLSKKHDVTVATSDNLEQIIIFGQGARRMSASEFYREVKFVEDEIREKFLKE